LLSSSIRDLFKVQIGGTLGIALVGSVCFNALGDGGELAGYARAFSVAAGCTSR
jgi:hypothetical protein